MFHVHIDATRLTDNFGDFLKVNGFWRTDFCGHPAGIPGFEPPHHLTWKSESASEFKEVFDRVVRHASGCPAGFTGYVEGEYVASDEEIPDAPFRKVPLPFVVSTARLPQGTFRETEIHVDFCRDRSHPDLICALTAMGFFSAYIPKPPHVAQIFTLQGSRGVVGALLPDLRTFLRESGGAVAGSIKEERVTRWWATADCGQFPPVVSAISHPADVTQT